ncbi:MAG TPA: FemAB family XrtA/PEP-CTERM system-associated protein [Candidatus Cybelea sp.]|nr:FemAB family XrtA/PEP-CTERM system-associated protein [Candidatus Cybelea sp.]
MNAEAPSSYLVRELSDAAGAARWDRFVNACPNATFLHRAGWKTVIEESFRHQSHYIYVERGGEIAGVLPLVHMKSRIFGNALVSIPFGVYGGPAGEDEMALRLLDAHAIELGERLDVDHIEYRTARATRPDWVTKADLYFTFRRPIVADAERNLASIPRKQRAVVRQSLKNGLEAAIDDDADAIHAVYAESVRNLGTPVFARSYFRNLKRVFGNDCELLSIRKDGRVVSGVLSFYFRDEVLPYYGGGVPEARKLGAADFMYWDVMRRAGERGCRIFDFGRSKQGTGAYSFKKNWGFAPEPLQYQFRLRRGQDVPDVNPLNPKYRLMIAMWKRLPLPVANTLGPFIVRSLG